MNVLYPSLSSPLSFLPCSLHLNLLNVLSIFKQRRRQSGSLTCHQGALPAGATGAPHSVGRIGAASSVNSGWFLKVTQTQGGKVPIRRRTPIFHTSREILGIKRFSKLSHKKTRTQVIELFMGKSVFWRLTVLPQPRQSVLEATQTQTAVHTF